MNKNNQVSSSDLIDAKLEEHQLCGSKHCPGCGHKLEGKPVRIIYILKKESNNIMLACLQFSHF